MKICFVGLGSIGKRHLKNLSLILTAQNISYEIDALRYSDAVLEEDVKSLINHTYTCYEELPADYEIAFITNPTALHYRTIVSMQGKAKHMFIEKPIFDRDDYDCSMFSNGESVYYVACPLRYTGIIQYLKQSLPVDKVRAVRAISSSYLPEWRLGVDYRRTYSAHKDEGGGVEIDLIHEWDYLTYLFGFPKEVKGLQGKYSGLEIDSNDIALYVADYGDKLVSLHLDYVGRVPKRQLEIYTDDDVIVGDFIKSRIDYLKSGKRLSFEKDRDAYQRLELEQFLKMIQGKAENINPINLALKVLRLVKTV